MRIRQKATAAILFAGALVFLAARPASAAWSVSISYFHQELSPYGNWVVSGTYGEVWHPTVAAGWQPYLDGEWVYSDYGWTWVSYDPFGPVPFHYGTWVWVDPYGWCWIPGYVWGPAWVTWAYTDSYIGWACLPPSFEITAAGYAGSPIVVPQSQYVFVPVNSFVGTSVSSVRLPIQQNATILTSANRVTRFSVSGGIVRASDPPPSLIQRVTGKTLHRTSLSSQKLRMTTLAAAGVGAGKRMRIVAPARERALAQAGAKPSHPRAAERSAPSRKSVREAAARSSERTARSKEATARSAPASRRPARAVKEQPRGGKPAGEKAVKAPRSPSAHSKTAGAPKRSTHAAKEKPSMEKAVRSPRTALSAHPKAETAPRRATEKARGREVKTSRPAASVERRSAPAAAAPPKEIRKEKPPAPAPRAIQRRSQNPPPAIEHPQRSSSAAPPRVAQAHPAPPQAAVAKPRGQPPPPSRPQPQGKPTGGKKEKE